MITIIMIYIIFIVQEDRMQHNTKDREILEIGYCIVFFLRAAAYTHLKEYKKAIIDCEKSVSIDPNYSKAYSRLGIVCRSCVQLWLFSVAVVVGVGVAIVAVVVAAAKME